MEIFSHFLFYKNCRLFSFARCNDVCDEVENNESYRAVYLQTHGGKRRRNAPALNVEHSKCFLGHITGAQFSSNNIGYLAGFT
jgi:hypothetical protein